MLHWIFILANLGHLIFSKYFIKRVLDRDEWLSLFQFKCRPWTTKKCQIFTLIYHCNFEGRCIWRFRRGAKILRGGAHLKIRLWKADLQCTELCQCENMESRELLWYWYMRQKEWNVVLKWAALHGEDPRHKEQL